MYSPCFPVAFIANCSARVRTPPFFPFLFSGLPLDALPGEAENDDALADQFHGKLIPKLSRPMTIEYQSDLSSALVATRIKSVGTRRRTTMGASCRNKLLERIRMHQTRNSSERCISGWSLRWTSSRDALNSEFVISRHVPAASCIPPDKPCYGYLAQW